MARCIFFINIILLAFQTAEALLGTHQSSFRISSAIAPTRKSVNIHFRHCMTKFLLETEGDNPKPELAIEKYPLLSATLDLVPSDDDTSLSSSASKILDPSRLQPFIIKHSDENLPAIRANTISNLLLLAAATYTVTSLLVWLLYNFESVQSWRYFWPLVGIVYLWEGVMSLLQLCDSASETSSNASPGLCFVSAIQSVAGLGLIIGGAYDAFMPVWMTGPNVFTSGGIGQDSALVLLVLQTIASITGRTMSDSTNNTVLMIRIGGKSKDIEQSTVAFWGQVLLLSQLAILSDSAMFDIVSKVSVALTPMVE